MITDNALFKQGQIDFLMHWIDSKVKFNVKEEAICYYLNISLEELKEILKAYNQWKENEKCKEIGRAAIVKTIVKRHEFLSSQEKANMLNISLTQLEYYLSLE